MRKKLSVMLIAVFLLVVVSFAFALPIYSFDVQPVGEGKLGGSLELTTTYGRATTVVAGWRAFLDVYGDIITFVNESVSATEWTLMYYNISTGTVTNTGVSVYDPYLLWHSIYDNLIASPGPYGDYGIGLYNISVGNVTKLPYPYFNDMYDVITWATVFPSNIISIYGDIIALCDHDGVWVYNITTSSIIANLTTGPPANRWGVSVYENLIAFSDNFIWYYNISTNIKTNTTVPGRMPSLYGNIIAFVDCDFQLIRYYNISSGQVSTIERVQPEGLYEGGRFLRPSIYGDVIVFSIYEAMIDGGTDVNGDGDMSDWVVRYYNLSTHMLVNTREIGVYQSIYGNTIVFQTYEPWVDTDLNEDGDKDDYVIRYIYLYDDVAVISVTPSVAEVNAGQPVNITVVARNEGTKYETFNVTTYYEDTPIETKTVTNLPPGEETPLTFTWDTAAIAPGDYTISAKASVLPGETDTTDNTYTDGTVTVLPPVRDIAVTNVTASTTVVCQGYSMSINVTVENQGTITENFNVTTYADLNATIIGDEITIGMQNVTLTSGSSTTVTLTWNTTGVEKGDYTISAKATPVPGETDTTDNTKVDGTVTVIVPGHDVAIKNVTPSKTIVGQNYSLTIHVTAKNYGNHTETFNVTAYHNTTPINTTEVTLTRGNIVTITFTWNTTDIAKGNYTISAYAWPVPGETDTTDNTLADGMVLVTFPGDVNGDGKVRVDDVLAVALAFGTDCGGPPNSNGYFYEPNLDITNDLKIRVDDVLIAALNFGQGP